MREIKFRAYNNFEKKFIYSDWKYGMVSFWDCALNNFNKEYEYPQQYTGLKDIYEGDIVRVQIPLGGFWGNTPNKKIAKVIYSAESARFIAEWDWSKNQHHIDIDCDLEMEIIGNIYENPELLKP